MGSPRGSSAGPAGTILLLAIAFIVILAGAELFTNAIEWLGHHLGLTEGAVGSVLAAVGTALPETMIPLVAIVFGVALELPRYRRRAPSWVPRSCWPPWRCS